jgi:DNA (cytosine-5)-methyltransferase 1
MQAHRFYDFFAGVGMAELALAPPWRCSWANDIDPKKAAIYRANHDPGVFHLGDVAKVDAADLPHGAAMAWASFPCQDLSLAGWRRGMTADRSGTFWAFWRLMRDLHRWGRRPPLIVIENVPGLLYGEDFGGLCEALAALDMQFGALVIDARRFVPQSRPRVFVVAADARLDLAGLTQDQLDESLWIDKRVRNAHERLAAGLQDRWRWWRLPEPTRPAADAASLIFDDPVGVSWHTAAETGHLVSLMSSTNLAKIERARRQSRRSVGFLYRRTRAGGQRAEVRFDGIAGCLRTATGGSSRQTVVIVEDGSVRTRLLAPREAARLMGLPDTFWLPDRYNDAYHAIGDGVAVPVVAWLGAHLLTPLASKLTPPLSSPLPVMDETRALREASDARARVWLANRS